jgi:hypothetical protein
MFGLEAVAARWAVEDVDELHEAALGEEIVELRRGIDRLEAQVARRVAVFKRRKGYLADGSVSIVAWLRHNCRLSFSSASERAALAELVDATPATAEAFAGGEIGYDNARVIARTVVKVGAEAYQPGEAAMLDAARRLDPGRLAVAAAVLRHCVDPDGTLADADHEHQLRRLTLSQTWQGRYVVDGWLDAEGGACLQAALNALIGPLCADDDRPFWQRRADALVELARQALDGGGLPEVAGQKPHLSLVVRTSDGGIGELEWGGPVPVVTALRLACDSALTKITADDSGEPLDAGRTVRTVPPAIRRALVVRDRGCRFPGCDRPSDWTDGHHLRHWAQGGETKLHNLVLLCRRHHRRVHEGGWRLAWGTRGELVASPP